MYGAANAQTVADLENLSLSANSYWNGSTSNATVSTSGTFTSGNCVFPNVWNGSFGGYWESGWAYSNMKDSTTAGYTNQYSVRSASGYSNSARYVVGQDGSVLKFNAAAQGKQMGGFYVNNSTYAALSMKNGDSFAKKFGGTSGNDPDWFKLKVQKFLSGSLYADSVVFYLADYRFSNNAQDYIVKTWQYVDLLSLGNADSLLFTLSSSDTTGGFMNTPGYFCLDNFTTLNSVTGIAEHKASLEVKAYPNPFSSVLNVALGDNVTEAMVAITDVTGKQVYASQLAQKESSLDLEHLQAGIYFIELSTNGQKTMKKLIKN